MSNPGRTGLILLSLSIAAISISCGEDQIQEVSYDLVEGWAELPEGIEAWGQTIGVEIDTGGNLLVFQRCFASNCIGRDEVPAFLKYNSDGKLVDSWGEGMFVWPHGFFLDSDGNIWTTDARGREGKGQQVLKFSPDGRVLMALGTPGVAGDGPNTLSGPTDIAVAPTGEIFVADGHGNNRIVKYSSDGEFLMEWGQEAPDLGSSMNPIVLPSIRKADSLSVTVSTKESRCSIKMAATSPSGPTSWRAAYTSPKTMWFTWLITSSERAS